MKRNCIHKILLFTLVLMWLGACSRDHKAEHHGHHEDESHHHEGPHGGKLFEEDGFGLEVTIYEPDIPPQSRVYAYHHGKLISPSEVELVTELHRIDRVDTMTYSPQDGYLLGSKIVEEPHSFLVKLKARYQGREYAWQYSSYEGRTEISSEAAQGVGIETEKSQAKNIRETWSAHGRIIPSPLQSALVSARFPGQIKAIHKFPGDTVEKGEVLASIESNESLKNYELRSPVSGKVLTLHKSVGELVAAQEALFLVGDLSRVWVEFAVPQNIFSKLRLEQKVLMQNLVQPLGEDAESTEGEIVRLSPLADSDSQSLLVYAEIKNASQTLTPELYVDIDVVLSERLVPVAVKKEALQQFRDWDVVFMKEKNTYEIAILELGAESEGWVEVLSGLPAGKEYVTKNSFVVKADVMKSGATHDH